jgi:hypothetical protein
MQGEDRLLVLALDADGLDARGAGSLQQRVAIGAIGLGALPVGADIVRREQPHLEAEADQGAHPVVGTAAGFHHHCAGLTRLPEALELRAGEALALDDLAGGRGDGDLEDVLGQIHGDG